MNYELAFYPQALKEWQKLDPNIRKQFKNKLEKVLLNPAVPANKLSTYPNCYKIKLRTSGYRLVYQIQEQHILVLVLAIGKRERQEAYRLAADRINT